jgi:predicted methyltransferase MtxX (methanogen marker protein 4)
LILQEVERKYRAENGIMGIRSPRYKERYEELLEKRQSAESVDEDEETLIQKLYEGEVDVAILNGMNSRVYYEVDEA